MSELTAADDFAEFSAADYYFRQGEIKGARRLLLVLGRAKFGRLDDGIHAAVNSITDLDQLERMTDAILDAKDWQELFSMTDCDAPIVITSSIASN
jgi:hypothetical protein